MLTNKEMTDLQNQVETPKEFFIKKELLTVDEFNNIINKKPNGKIQYSRWIVKNPNGKENVMVLVISKLFSELNENGIPTTVAKLIGIGQINKEYYDFGQTKITRDVC